MKRINLVYEREYFDVDIALVPDEVADNIDHAVRTFENWLSNPQNSEPFARYTENGERYLATDTKEFIWWLNNICCPEGEQSVVLEQHVYYHPEYPRADF